MPPGCRSYTKRSMACRFPPTNGGGPPVRNPQYAFAPASLLAPPHPPSQPLIKRLVDWIWKLRYSGFPAMETLAETLDNWSSEIACMWRFTKNNGITEGFHTKMEVIQRRAYGFKNFTNYRLRVIVMCG